MNRVLLIGAGFSRNWDGLLADEVSSHLSSIIQNNSFLINLLHQCDGFEAAFEKLRINYQTDPNTSNRNNIQIFQNALRDVFGNMNLAYSKKGTINFSQDRNLSIVKFLARFNSIFSLNQDLLLELLYGPHVALEALGKWNGVYFPGLKPTPNGTSEVLNSKWKLSNDFSPQPYLQPIYKLHGSVNWYEGEENPLMVIGENKLKTISDQLVLRHNNGAFFENLIRPDTKLMIIGYGFRDDHINQFITNAHNIKNFPIFMIHPEGKKHLKNINKT